MMQLKYYQDGDYEKIEDPTEPLEMAGLDFELIKEKGVYLSVYDDDCPIGTGGITYLSDDSGLVWLRISKTMSKRQPILLMRMLEKGLEIATDSLGMDRLMAFVREDYKMGNKFAKHFGFKEDKIEQYSGKNYKVYSWQTQ